MVLLFVSFVESLFKRFMIIVRLLFSFFLCFVKYQRSVDDLRLHTFKIYFPLILVISISSLMNYNLLPDVTRMNT